MLGANADSNLLFGMTALQMDFINRDELLAAMQAWTFEKSRQLGDILIEQNALTESQKNVLVELVSEHLKQHDDDAQKSLAAIPPDSSISEVLQSIDDRDVQDSLIHFAITQTPDTYATRQASIPPDDNQRFRILRPHAQGGLGQISVALDKELHREVALKELQMKYASNEATRERFMIEAEITGGLEHPSIVPVYGLGHYSDGRPYYAMRFIRGDNLQEAIDAYHRSPLDAKNLELHKLLRRFIDVCDAVHYAHSRGVLHRDLKPGNIMLGKYGETLLVDWGLAKPIDGSEVPTVLDGPPLQVGSGSGSSPTSMGSVVGTPGYMSPEQAAGRLDLLGPASDVYGLGATLYHLLTGEAPFRDKLSDVLKKIERGEFRSPRKVNPRIPAALEAICLHAMQRQPEDRYSSAASLADDVEHWLADEVVSVWKETPLQQLRRWTRRHWNTAVAVASVGCAALVVLGIGILQSRRAFHHEQQQHAVVRQVVDDYFTDVSESTLLNQPGAQPLRQQLLDRALTFYEQFVRDNTDDPAARAELAKAHYRIGLIKEATETPEAALAAFDQAIVILDSDTVATGDSADRQRDLGLAVNARGRVLLESGQQDEAIKAFQRAISIREPLAAGSSGNSEFARLLANSHMNLGESYRRMGNLEQAFESITKSQAIRSPFLDNSADAKLLRDSAKASYNLGNLAVKNKELDTADDHFATAVWRLNDLDPLGTGDLEMAEMMALSHRRLADVYAAESRQDEALTNYAIAEDVSGPLAGNNPSVRRYQATHVGILINYASLLATLDQVDEAITKYELAEKHVLKLRNAGPESIDYMIDQLTVQTNLGRLFMWLERPSDAARPLTSAQEMLDTVVEAKASRDMIWAKTNYELQSAKYHWAIGDLPKAISMLSGSLGSVDALHNRFPDETEIADTRLEVLAIATAMSVSHSGDESLKDAGETLGQLSDDFSATVSESLRDSILAGHLHTAGRLQWAAGSLERARSTFEVAIRQMATVASNSDEQQLSMIRGDLAALLLEIGTTEIAAANDGAAREPLERARDLLVPLAEKYPEDEFFQKDLQAVVDALSQLGDSEASE